MDNSCIIFLIKNAQSTNYEHRLVAGAQKCVLHKIKSTWEYFSGVSCVGAGKPDVLGRENRGAGGGERGVLGSGSWARSHNLAFSLPAALPLMNGYSGYEQHHSGEAAPVLGCGLWLSNVSLWLGLLCAVVEGVSCFAPCLRGGFALGLGGLVAT